MGKARPTNYWVTWKGHEDEPPPSEAECLQSCIENAEQAAQLERRAREAYRRAMPGSEALFKARYQILQQEVEQKHWREYANWYRKRLAPATAASSPKAIREVGADDDEDDETTQEPPEKIH